MAKGVSSAHISRRMAIGFIRKSRDFSLSWLMTKMLPDANFRSVYRALLFLLIFFMELPQRLPYCFGSFFGLLMGAEVVAKRLSICISSSFFFFIY